MDYQSYLYLIEELASSIHHRPDIVNAEKGEHIKVMEEKCESSSAQLRQNIRVNKNVNVNENVKDNACVDAKANLKTKRESCEIQSHNEKRVNEQRRMMYYIQ